MNALTHARFYATHHHVFQKRQTYGVLPYTHHLFEVERVLRGIGDEREHMLVAAWLHDIVEDTDVKVRDVEENFGEEVALLVAAVTSEQGIDRKVRNLLTYPKIREAGPDAIRLKLADRIANVANGLEHMGSMTRKYAKEYADFRHALFVPGDGNVDLWQALNTIMEMASKTK